jgi:hypothetical protein
MRAKGGWPTRSVELLAESWLPREPYERRDSKVSSLSPTGPKVVSGRPSWSGRFIAVFARVGVHRRTTQPTLTELATNRSSAFPATREKSRANVSGQVLDNWRAGARRSERRRPLRRSWYRTRLERDKPTLLPASDGR